MNPRRSPDRLCALTDGVYAIVLTLLVLDLKPPEVAGLTNTELAHDLKERIPNIAAYCISFFVVSYYWLQHHRVFSSLKECDARTLIENFVHLFLISLTPFSASLIGRYPDDYVPVILFSALLGLASLLGTRLALYIARHEDWFEEGAHGIRQSYPWWVLYFSSLVAVASILVSFVSGAAAVALWLILPIRNLFVRIS